MIDKKKNRGIRAGIPAFVLLLAKPVSSAKCAYNPGQSFVEGIESIRAGVVQVVMRLDQLLLPTQGQLHRGKVRVVLGTGFIVKTRDKSGFAYGVTAKHVIDAFGQQTSPLVTPLIFRGRPVPFGRKQLMVGMAIPNLEQKQFGNAQISMRSGFENRRPPSFADNIN